MKRQDKYPNTTTFTFYNRNPRNRFTTDCVVRAVSTVLDISWEDTVKELSRIAVKSGYAPLDRKVYDALMREYGYVMLKQPRKDDNTKYTGKEFCKALHRDVKSLELPYNICTDRILAHIGGNHIVAIINNKVHDIWDSTDGCIGNIWVRV